MELSTKLFLLGLMAIYFVAQAYLNYRMLKELRKYEK